MTASNESDKRQRHELYVGVFYNHLWNSESLCDYFHHLIEESNITQCHIYPCVNAVKKDYSFAILTFASISSIDQCLSKRAQIKQEHKFFVKRNIREISKDQRAVTEHILIYLDKFDLLYNKQNVLNYFGEYGSIVRWKILDNGRIFLLTFKDYDSVDRIFLDQPHFVNQNSLLIKKCYNPSAITLNYSTHNCLKERVRNIQASIERSKYLHESELVKVKKKIQEEVLVEENSLAEAMKLCIDLQQTKQELKQDLVEVRRINQQLKKQFQETVEKNKIIVDQFDSQLEQQRSTNKLLQDSIVNSAQN